MYTITQAHRLLWGKIAMRVKRKKTTLHYRYFINIRSFIFERNLKIQKFRLDSEIEFRTSYPHKIDVGSTKT